MSINDDDDQMKKQSKGKVIITQYVSEYSSVYNNDEQQVKKIFQSIGSIGSSSSSFIPEDIPIFELLFFLIS